MFAQFWLIPVKEHAQYFEIQRKTFISNRTKRSGSVHCDHPFTESNSK